jgi:chorismate synthase
MDGDKIIKATNHAGGILGGMSDGSEIVIRAYFKPTPSIFQKQQTVNKSSENIDIQIKGRHDPIIVPRAVVVVESMTALTILDMLLQNMTSRVDKIKKFYE